MYRRNTAGKLALLSICPDPMLPGFSEDKRVGVVTPASSTLPVSRHRPRHRGQGHPDDSGPGCARLKSPKGGINAGGQAGKRRSGKEGETGYSPACMTTRPPVPNLDAQIMPVQEKQTHKRGAARRVGLDVPGLAVPEHGDVVNIEIDLSVACQKRLAHVSERQP